MKYGYYLCFGKAMPHEGFKLSLKHLRVSRPKSLSRKSGSHLEGACLFCYFNLLGFLCGMPWETSHYRALSWQLGRRDIVRVPRCLHSSLFPSVSLVRVVSALVLLYHSGKIRAICWCNFLRKEANCLGSLGQNSRKGTKISCAYLEIPSIAETVVVKPGPELCDSPQKPANWKNGLWKLSVS